jgi:hypothetical protein
VLTRVVPSGWIVAIALLCSACATPEAAPAPSIVIDSRPGTLASIPTGGSGNCREFHDTVTIGGVPQESYGTACRQPDGSWRIMPPGAAAPPTTTTYNTTTYVVQPYPYPYYFGSPFFGSAFFFSHRHHFHHHRFHHRH